MRTSRIPFLDSNPMISLRSPAYQRRGLARAQHRQSSDHLAFHRFPCWLQRRLGQPQHRFLRLDASWAMATSASTSGWNPTATCCFTSPRWMPTTPGICCRNSAASACAPSPPSMPRSSNNPCCSSEAAVEINAGDTTFRVWVDANAPVIRVQGHSTTPRKASLTAETLRPWKNAADPLPASGTAALLFHDNSDTRRLVLPKPIVRLGREIRRPEHPGNGGQGQRPHPPPHLRLRALRQGFQTHLAGLDRHAAPVTDIDATVRVLTESAIARKHGNKRHSSQRSPIGMPTSPIGNRSGTAATFSSRKPARAATTSINFASPNSRSPAMPMMATRKFRPRRTPIRSPSATPSNDSAKPSPAAARSRRSSTARSSPWTCPPA